MIYRVSAEWRQWPVWISLEDGGVDNLDPHAMPICEELASGLVAWSDAFDAIFDEDYPPDSAFATPADEEAWLTWGERLTRQFAVELGPAVRVVYGAPVAPLVIQEGHGPD